MRTVPLGIEQAVQLLQLEFVLALGAADLLITGPKWTRNAAVWERPAAAGDSRQGPFGNLPSGECFRRLTICPRLKEARWARCR